MVVLASLKEIKELGIERIKREINPKGGIKEES
jgi:hypothetical protein